MQQEVFLMKETVNIGLIGFGTIGSGVVATLNQNLPLLENKVNKKVNLKRIVDLDITTDRGVEVQPGVLSTSVDDILEDEEIDIVIELVGGYQPALRTRVTQCGDPMRPRLPMFQQQCSVWHPLQVAETPLELLFPMPDLLGRGRGRRYRQAAPRTSAATQYTPLESIRG